MDALWITPQSNKSYWTITNFLSCSKQINRSSNPHFNLLPPLHVCKLKMNKTISDKIVLAIASGIPVVLKYYCTKIKKKGIKTGAK